MRTINIRKHVGLIVFFASALLIIAGCTTSNNVEATRIISSATQINEGAANPTITSPTPTQTTPPLTPASAVPPIQADSPSVSGVSYSTDILPMFIGRCDACHGWEEGRFDPNTYDGLLSVVNVDDPGKSTIVQMMIEGHHTPGLASDELALVIEWILQGAQDN